MSRVIDFLTEHESTSSSSWKKDALWRRDNERWLKYARAITIRIIDAMDEQSITQSVLAQRMGCSQQYVSNILRVNSNMTLETIAKLEDALGIDILNTTFNYVSGYFSDSVTAPSYGNDEKK